MIEFHPGTQIPKSRFNAFDIPPKGVARECTAPKKRGPKRKSKELQSVMALETMDERKVRQAQEKRQADMAKIMRKNPYSDIAVSTRNSGDRAGQIRKGGVM